MEYHEKIKADPTFDVKVLPAFRPDKAFGINLPTFTSYISKLSEASGIAIQSLDGLIAALENRVQYFHDRDCRVSDHGLDYVPYAPATKEEASAIFEKALQGQAVSLHEEKQFKTYVLIYLGKLYSEHGWVMQYHMNALRNNNTRMFEAIGPDTGFDSINDMEIASQLSGLLNSIDHTSGLAEDDSVFP